jgi:glycosyltransferase involved in cell wall biosynthesis
MKKVTILVFNNFTHDNRVLREGLSLKNAGYEVQVVALHEGNLPKKEVKEGLHIDRLSLLSRKLPTSIFFQIFKWLELFLQIALKYRKTDYLHVCDVLPLPMAVWTKRFFNRSIKIIYDAHELEFQKNTNSKRYGQLIAWLEAKHLRYADAMITVTELIAEEYEEHYGIEKPVVVHNFPYKQNIGQQDIFRQKFGIRADQKILLYQGVIAPNRGCELLIEAFKEMPDDIVLVLLGYGALWDKIKSMSSNMNNVFMHEAVGYKELLKHTASADFGIYSVINSNKSHDYSLGNKVFEYIMAGLPIISTNLKGTRSFLNEDFTVFIDEINHESLKNAIGHFNSLDQNKLKKDIQDFAEIANWDKEQHKLLNIYKNA